MKRILLIIALIILVSATTAFCLENVTMIGPLTNTTEGWETDSGCQGRPIYGQLLQVDWEYCKGSVTIWEWGTTNTVIAEDFGALNTTGLTTFTNFTLDSSKEYGLSVYIDEGSTGEAYQATGTVRVLIDPQDSAGMCP